MKTCRLHCLLLDLCYVVVFWTPSSENVWWKWLGSIPVSWLISVYFCRQYKFDSDMNVTMRNNGQILFCYYWSWSLCVIYFPPKRELTLLFDIVYFNENIINWHSSISFFPAYHYWLIAKLKKNLYNIWPPFQPILS